MATFLRGTPMTIFKREDQAMFKMSTLVHQVENLNLNLKFKIKFKFSKIFCSHGQGLSFKHGLVIWPK